ncbi:hypothetical protein [Zymobacter sp. IVIA_5232.4 C2]|uniref:hypothetical protein n=1 Tax=Zymobacter sp. IVIA_5232.4 C2 TaxID=3394855 RepID=UPI0039C010BF
MFFGNGLALSVPTECHHPAFLHSCIPAFLHSCIPAFLHSCIPAFLHSCIPAFLHSCIPAFGTAICLPSGDFLDERPRCLGGMQPSGPFMLVEGDHPALQVMNRSSR